MKIKNVLLSLACALLPLPSLQAETIGIQQEVDMQGNLSHGQTPLWLNANRYGLSALTQANGYLGYKVASEADYGKLQLFAGARLILPTGYRYQGLKEHYTSHFILQEAYFDAAYRNIYLSIGAKERILTLRDNTLSSGSQTFGKNARPVPQIRLGLRDFWSIPGTKDWVAIKGHVAFGVMTDGEWESCFAAGSRYKYNRLTRYHEKAGYLRIAPQERPLTVTAGLEMAAQFGGYLYNCELPDSKGGYITYPKLELANDLTSYKNAFLCTTSGDTGETTFKNNEGNLLGSWVARIDYKAPSWAAGLYFDHFFEDHSSMFFLDYDGYGTGSEWNTKKEHRMFVYNPADFQLGADLTLKQNRWLNKVTVEYLSTTYQSGPIYHDHNASRPDHVCGIDNYYNNSTLPGWQHWGQVMGNPLYISPQYNENGNIGCINNRFRAWHLGVKGNPIPLFLSYRCLLSYEKNWGSYYYPHLYPKEDVSLLFEVETALFPDYLEHPIHLTIGYGQDWGKLLGNNCGIQIGLRYMLGEKTVIR